MLIHRAPTPLGWPVATLPLAEIARDWSGHALSPPAAFAVAVDPARLWLVAARAVPPALRPHAVPGAFTPELWRWDVAELFVGSRERDAYVELNLAPDGAWWACEFTAPRRRRQAEPLAPPRVRTWAAATADGGWRSALAVPLGVVRDAVGADEGSWCGHVAFVLNPPDARFLTSGDPLTGAPDFHAPAVRRPVVFTAAAG
jgi:hypothetical protein